MNHVLLVSDQAMPNFLPVLNKELKPTTVTLAVSSKMQHRAQWLKNEIEKLSYANEDLLEEKRIWKQMSDEYTKLSYENKQLKQKIKSINEILNEDTGYIESLRKIEEVLK